MALTAPRNPPPPAPTGWSLAVAGGEPMALTLNGNATANGLVARVRLCALGRDGSIAAQPSSQRPLASGSVAFDLATSASAQAILDEACP